jgi:nucleotide-binding universal stress UspA family protein
MNRDTIRDSAAASRRSTASRNVHKILAVVDGSERTGRILEYLIEMASPPIKVVLLNIQPAPENWRLRGYLSFKADEIFDRLVNDLGGPIVKGAGRRLQEAGITHSEIVKLGNFTDSVLACQRDEACELIVLGETRAGPLRKWLLRNFGITVGSPAQVAQLTDVPVVLVK